MSQEKLLLIPGPSPVHPRILEVLARPTVSHVGPEMAAELREACANLKQVVFCAEGEAFIVSGGGTLAMEMALLNVVGPGERVLVLSQGYFGRRMGDICSSFQIAHDVLEAEWGTVVSPEDLAVALGRADYDVVVCTHVDTATGAMAPVEAYAARVKSAGSLFIVDGVCATGGVPEKMDDWGIDVVFSAAQKCFGAPPGLALCVFSRRAVDKRRSLAAVPAYYSDILRWLPVMTDPTVYFATPCVNEIRAFGEALRIVLEEGLEARFSRHVRNAEAVRAGLAAMGFGFFTHPSCLAPTLSVVTYPEGVEDKAFRSVLYANNIVVAGGLAHTAGKVFRMGHMGNLTAEQIRFALQAVERSLVSLGACLFQGAGVRAADRVFHG
ncbi:MAG: alanine--glyoxylate aminotransferase family protein [Acidobacteriota bacterium]|nr:alanine--glyoxylate aminotransferase family protein [Acidobacteriota bacterium]